MVIRREWQNGLGKGQEGEGEGNRGRGGGRVLGFMTTVIAMELQWGRWVRLSQIRVSMVHSAVTVFFITWHMIIQAVLGLTKSRLVDLVHLFSALQQIFDISLNPMETIHLSNNNRLDFLQTTINKVMYTKSNSTIILDIHFDP